MTTKEKIHDFYRYLLDMIQLTKGIEHKAYIKVVRIFRLMFEDELKDYKPVGDYGTGI